MPELADWAESRVVEGRFSSTSDYVSDLVRRDREYENRRVRLQAAIEKGRASGVCEQDAFAILSELRARLDDRATDAA